MTGEAVRAVEHVRGNLLLLLAGDAATPARRQAVQANPSPVDAPDGGDDLPAVVAGERRDAVRAAALADALPVGVGRGELLHPQALRALVVGAALSASEAFALPVLVANLEDFPRAA
ncbi:MAG TPA: hypothetical protein PLB94_10640 [Microbacteriaceae bacterium]|nr:hypothetical protein [Microbacteriaceae bacterium]